MNTKHVKALLLSVAASIFIAPSAFAEKKFVKTWNLKKTEAADTFITPDGTAKFVFFEPFEEVKHKDYLKNDSFRRTLGTRRIRLEPQEILLKAYEVNEYDDNKYEKQNMEFVDEEGNAYWIHKRAGDQILLIKVS